MGKRTIQSRPEQDGRHHTFIDRKVGRGQGHVSGEQEGLRAEGPGGGCGGESAGLAEVLLGSVGSLWGGLCFLRSWNKPKDQGSCRVLVAAWGLGDPWRVQLQGEWADFCSPLGWVRIRGPLGCHWRYWAALLVWPRGVGQTLG